MRAPLGTPNRQLWDEDIAIGGILADLEQAAEALRERGDEHSQNQPRAGIRNERNSRGEN